MLALNEQSKDIFAKHEMNEFNLSSRFVLMHLPGKITYKVNNYNLHELRQIQTFWANLDDTVETKK